MENYPERLPPHESSRNDYAYDDPQVSASPPPAPRSPVLSLNDIYYVLFRHKGKILGCTIAGLLAAAGVYWLYPREYVAEAKLLIRYVPETTTPAPLRGDAQIIEPGGRGQAVMDTEVQILTSRDLAVDVARALGPDWLLASQPGPKSLDAAVAQIAGNISASYPRFSSVVRLEFRHPNRDIVRPVLEEVISSYLKRHRQVHLTADIYDEILSKETDQARARLTQLEAELRAAEERAGVLPLETAQERYSGQIGTIEEEIRRAERELAERKALLASLTGGTEAPVPAETATETPAEAAEAEAEIPETVVQEYDRVRRMLGALREREIQYSMQYTLESVAMRGLLAQMEDYRGRKAKLEAEYPALLGRPPLPGASGGGESGGIDIAREHYQIRALETRIRVLNEQLREARNGLIDLREAAPEIVELRRRRDLQEAQYRNLLAALEQSRIDKTIRGDRVSNISVIQTPSIPYRDLGKLYKVVAGLAVAGVAVGLGLAFGLEMFIDQSIKRPVEVESRLGVPLFLTFPFADRRNRLGAAGRPPALPGAGPALEPALAGARAGEEIQPWAPDHQLRAYFEALRDQLLYYFEVRNLTRKPKLVAITGCSEGSGASTIAAGLAASLSQTGDGNVLLVDVNPGQKPPHYFHKGELKCGLDDALAHEKREEAFVSEKLYVVSHAAGENGTKALLPRKFGHIIPKLKASDYDYIIFDMPPVNQLSVTPQLARYMDMVFMVVESEKTDRNVAARATNTLTSSGANVSVILNKTKSYVPKRLLQEF